MAASFQKRKERRLTDEGLREFGRLFGKRVRARNDTQLEWRS
jgi:hypothetical protein